MTTGLSKEDIELQEFQRKLDDLKCTVKAMAEDNINTGHEVIATKMEMANLIVSALKVKKRIKLRKSHLTRIYNEAQSLLKSYCSHLKVLAQQEDDESKLDWRMFESGQIETIDDFLEVFLEHRKDHHIYWVKACKLSDDLSLLDKFSLSSESCSEESESD